MTTPAEAPRPDTPAVPASALLRRGVALTHLGLLGATEVTRLTAEMHATISGFPLPWKADATRPAEKAPLPYHVVLQSLRYLARLTGQYVDSHDTEPAGRRWTMFRSILNGVAGDVVRDWDSPLQQRMTLVDAEGRPLTPQDWREQASRGGVLFLHGLCLSELEWQTAAHHAFVQELRNSGRAVAWLRYNTGRPIHENGQALANLLERAGFGQGSELTLIGHSMGGLLIRSATYHAQQLEQRWLQQLRHAAYLGSPHHGSPYERLGHRANSLLGLMPYTKPLMQLGNLRSSGIMDLRHGRVVPPGRPHPASLHEGARHLLLAAHMGQDASRQWIGDGLVPVPSALGQHPDPARALAGDTVTRVTLPALGHLAILSDDRVYLTLREWLDSA